MQSLTKTLNQLIEPSPKIIELDRRRQASLLSGFLLGIMLVAAVVEVITVLTIAYPGYTGYRITVAVILLLAVLYFISRTERVQLAALLTVIVMSAGAWVAGLLDLLFIPLWLGSLFMRMRQVVMLMLAEMALMLFLPAFLPGLTYDSVLGGPFSFLLLTSFVLAATTYYRNVMERDRQQQLAEQERTSRREATRAAALLHVAEHLNAQLDLEPLLQAICEETAHALEVPLAFVSLYDARKLVLVPTLGTGFTLEQIRAIPPVAKVTYNATIETFGTPFAILDIEAHATTANIMVFQEQEVRSLAAASIRQGGELIGTLSALSVGTSRQFSEDELLLLQGIADQAALAIINSRLHDDARRRMEHLQALRAIDQAIVSQHELKSTLEVLLTQITRQLNVDAAVILLMDAGARLARPRDRRTYPPRD